MWRGGKDEWMPSYYKITATCFSAGKKLKPHGGKVVNHWFVLSLWS